MRSVFIDTNILIDLVADRKPYSKFAIQIFESGESKKLKLYTSSHAIATTYYILKKHVEDKELRRILEELLEYVSIVAISQDMTKRSLRSRHKDFEDALQISAAQSIDKMECIITRNIKDFKEAEIPVLSPDEFVLSL